MTGFDYARSAATADRLIKRFGRVVPYGRNVPGTGPAHNPGPSTWDDSTQAVIVILPASKGPLRFFDNMLEPGTLIDAQWRFCYLSPKKSDGTLLGFQPASTDRVFFDGHHWSVLGATPLNPGGVDVYFIFGAKRL